MGLFYGWFYTPTTAESSAKAAAGVFLEKQDQAWLKAFCRSQGGGGPVAGICYTVVNLLVTTFLCRAVLQKGENMIRQLKTIQ